MEIGKTNLPSPTDARLSAILIAGMNKLGDHIADRVMPRTKGAVA